MAQGDKQHVVGTVKVLVEQPKSFHTLRTHDVFIYVLFLEGREMGHLEDLEIKIWLARLQHHSAYFVLK